MIHARRARHAAGAAWLVGAFLVLGGGGSARAQAQAAGARTEAATMPASLQVILPIASSLTALLAVFFGPWVQVTIAKRQQRASVVSTSRVRSIDDFRREVAELIAASHLLEMQRHHFGQALAEGEGTSQSDAYREAFHTSFLRVNTLVHTIALRLELSGPEAPVDNEIWARIGRVVSLDVRQCEFDNDLKKYEAALFTETELLRNAVRAKFSDQWKRVERLE